MQIEGAAVKIPSLEHLVALKVHAIKHGQGLRVMKDVTDVAELLKFRRVDPKSPWLKTFSRNTATPNPMSESSNSFRETANHGDSDLEFPDWSGQLPRRSRVSNEKWLQYCRSNLHKLRSYPGYTERRRRNGIPVEFVL